MLRSVLGNPVVGDDFYNREKEQRGLWRNLETNNILLLAPRRVGKTSLMLRLQDTAQDHQHQALYVSVAGARSETEFVTHLYSALAKASPNKSLFKRWLGDPVADLFKKLDIRKVEAGGVGVEFGEKTPKQWEALGEALIKMLCSLEGQWLLMIDELPVFLLRLMQEDPQASRIRHFLNWFRDLRIDRHHAHVHWLLAGSIGLDTVTQLHNLGDTINDLYIQNLPPFEIEYARSFLLELDKNYKIGFTPPLVELVLARVGWPIPYFLQLYYNAIREICEDQGVPLSNDVIQQALETLLQPTRRNYFDYWRQRLEEELGATRAQRAVVLLCAVAAPPEGARPDVLRPHLESHIQDAHEREKEFRFLLGVLEGDGYLVQHDSRYQFRSPLLREYWLRHVHA